MRITSGIYKNREIASPRDARTHPMGDRERLALFNMLMTALPGARVLDAYAGTGALGIEALSRGAKSVTFVEQARGAARIIRENLRSLGVDESILQVICQDVNNIVFREEFDVILADPPYDRFDASEVENLIKLLKHGGVFVLSHPGVAPILNGLMLEKTRKYAGAQISFYIK